MTRDPTRPWMIKMPGPAKTWRALFRNWRIKRLKSKCQRLSSMIWLDPSIALRDELVACLCELARLQSGQDPCAP